MTRRVEITFFTAVLLTAFVGLLQGCSSSGNIPAVPVDANTIAVFGDQSLTVSDFEREYARSVGGVEAASDDSLAELEDFLERYVDFRLKVLAAREAGIDRDPEIISEIRNYQSQFARPYLLEQEVIEPLVRDLYDKQAFMVEASHILVRVPIGAAPEDSLAAYNRMVGLVDSLEAGRDFGDIAYAYSDDPSASNEGQGLGYRGYLGFFSGGRMVQDFEDRAFSTPIGSTSPIFRTQYGYHVLKVTDKKPAVAPIRLSHLMVVVDSTTSEEAAGALISAIADSARSGFPFEGLVQRHSDDQWSKDKGGDIGMQSFDDRLLPALKDPAFELENVGDVTDPIRTQFGFHLLQLTERGDLPTFEESYDELKKRALRLPRARAKEIEFGKKALARLGSSYDTTAVISFFQDAPADSLEQFFRSAPFDSTTLDAQVASIGDSTYNFQNVVATSGSRRYAATTAVDEFVDDVMSQFLIDKAIDYEVSLLETIDPEFSATMNDFRDGLVLFKFMEDSVWTAATQDSVALEQLYNEDPTSYMYPERTQLVTYHSQSGEQLKSLLAELRSGKSYAEIDSSITVGPMGAVRVDTINVSTRTDSVLDTAIDLPEGQYVDPTPYNRGFVVILNNGTLPARGKTYEEAQSDLISEYQTILEERIVTRLREKYRARTFPQKLMMAYMDSPSMETPSSSESQ
ncbi:MAG: hypothetical protein HKN43_14400 [Rhodothermales bacterium]|nr:hypothetical protein [Rhodothermales bacterium]